MAVSCLHTFFLRSHNCQVLPLVTRGLLPHVLKCINKMYLHSTQWDGVLKQSRGGDGIIQISQKEKLFQSHKKLSSIWVNLTLHHPFLPLSKKTFLFPSVRPSNQRIYMALSLRPNRQSRKRMMNTFLMIFRCMQPRPLLRPKNLYYAQNTLQ